MSGLDNEYVTSVDDQEISTPYARKFCMRSKGTLTSACSLYSPTLSNLVRLLVFYAGFALLPWLWVMNVWLFWHDFRHGRDSVIQKCEGPHQRCCRLSDIWSHCTRVCRHSTVRGRVWSHYRCVVSLDSSIFVGSVWKGVCSVHRHVWRSCSYSLGSSQGKRTGLVNGSLTRITWPALILPSCRHKE